MVRQLSEWRSTRSEKTDSTSGDPVATDDKAKVDHVVGDAALPQRAPVQSVAEMGNGRVGNDETVAVVSVDQGVDRVAVDVDLFHVARRANR